MSGAAMRVPFLDLAAQYRAVRPEVGEAFEAVFAANAFSGGPFVERFEREWAAFLGAGEAVGVGSGTEALELILQVLGVGPGDEVITVPNTFIATAEAVSRVGATPVFVDVDPVHLSLDPDRLEAAISGRTRAVIPVHLFGRAAELGPILEVARRHGLPVVEDACQAHGAEYGGRKVGTIGVAGAFSFYPGKNLGAYGEGGAVVSGDAALAARIRRLRDHGQSRKYVHEEVGCNARLDGLQAAALSVKLTHLGEWNAARREAAERYRRLLAGLPGLELPPGEPEAGRHVWHLYPVRVAERDRVQAALSERGVGTAIHYPVPVHLQAAYARLGLGPGSFPAAEQAARRLLSLPMYPELTEAQQATVAEALAEALEEVRREPAGRDSLEPAAR